MRLSSNKLSNLILFFHSELAEQYESSEIDAILNLVLEYYLGFSKTDVHTKKNENINQSDLLKLYFCCKELRKNIPIQYILKEAWFYNLKFFVNAHVLIPRPETEELVDYILKENSTATSFLDIGTGSGCIPITLKKNIPSAKTFALDISEGALAVANQNANINAVEIEFIKADVLNTDETLKKIETTFDVIVSNPPYVKRGEKETIAKHVFNSEPHLALFVEDEDDIVFYKQIINLCKKILNTNGKLYFELNPLTASEVKDYALASNQFKHVRLFNDLSGKIRFLKAFK